MLIDCANGAAAATAPDLFANFDIEADFIHKKPNGVNINLKCVLQHFLQHIPVPYWSTYQPDIVLIAKFMKSQIDSIP